MVIYLAWLGGLIGVLATIPYLLSAWRGVSTPNPVTWGIWSMKGVLMVVGLWQVGLSESIILPIAFAVGRIATFLVAVRQSYRFGTISLRPRFFPEGICFAGATAAMCLILFGVNPWFPLALLLLMDLLGFLPTALRTWQGVQVEPLWPWLLFLTAGLLGLIGAAPYRMEDLVFPIWVIVTCLVILPVAGHRGARRRNTPGVPAYSAS
jgi:hypothetical protein